MAKVGILFLLFVTASSLSIPYSPEIVLASPSPWHTASISDQAPNQSEPPYEGVGHFSEWSRLTKNAFLEDVSNNQAGDWIMVLGNEGGDTDSMTSALVWAYHLTHLNRPVKAVALLQTEEDALDLRPENKLALERARMANGHRDLLTIDELPIKPFELARRIKGVALVDHNRPLVIWEAAPIVSIIDHHADSGVAPSAHPRVIGNSASCSSLVAKMVLDAEERGDHKDGHDPLPLELVELLMRAIAVDSGGLTRKIEHSDVESAERLWMRSSWQGEDLNDVMGRLSGEMRSAKRSLDGLGVRDLLRRDWKGDTLQTKSSEYPEINLGFASIPYSMNYQIAATPEGTTPEWFAIERAYTAEKGADVSVCLTSFRDSQTGDKIREIAIVVAHGWGGRLSDAAADDLFRTLRDSIIDSSFLQVTEWKRPDGKPLLPRRAVWRQVEDGSGRKVVRPIVEAAARGWAFGGE